MAIMLTRRAMLATGAAFMALPARAASPIALQWGDLAPRQGMMFESMRLLGIVEHGQMSTPFDQETAAVMTDAYNGKRVSLPGYAIPLDFEGEGATTMILAPYVGACIHVPPPPPNQLVLVTSERPYRYEGLFEPVTVTGVFNTMASETELAEIGYQLEAERIEPYDG